MRAAEMVRLSRILFRHVASAELVRGSQIVAEDHIGLHTMRHDSMMTISTDHGQHT